MLYLHKILWYFQSVPAELARRVAEIGRALIMSHKQSFKLELQQFLKLDTDTEYCLILLGMTPRPPKKWTCSKNIGTNVNMAKMRKNDFCAQLF